MHAFTNQAIAIASMAAWLIVAEPVAAQSILKCVDRDGHVAFQDKPCAAGQREQQVVIDPAPPTLPSPDYSAADRADSSRPQRSKRQVRQPIIYSFECRTQTGALFFRHDHCPASIDRSGLIGGSRSAGREKVRGSRIPRIDACRGMRSVGRDGREFDDEPTTYERNLGRDPCRRY